MGCLSWLGLITAEKNQVTLNIIMYSFMLVFTATAVIVYYYAILNRKKKGIEDIEYKSSYLYVIIGFALLIRVVSAVSISGHPADMGYFKEWSSIAATNLPRFYSNSTFVDYPPLYIYILFFIGRTVNLLDIGSIQWAYSLAIKFPSIVADIVTVWLIFRFAKKRLAIRTSLFLAGLYAFNPLVILNSSMWGQVDSFLTMILVFALFLIAKDKIRISSVVFTLAILMKPQGIFFLPVLFFELARKKSIGDFIVSFAYAVATTVVVTFPFYVHQKPSWLFDLYFKTVEGYKYATVNAYNLFALSGANWVPDSSKFLLLDYKTWGYIFILTLVVLTAFLYLRAKKHTGLGFVAAMVLNAGVFVLSSRMHERYMFPVMATAIMAYILVKDKRIIPLYLGFTLTGFINTFTVFIYSLRDNYCIPRDDRILIVTSILNILLLVWLVKISIDISAGKVYA